MVDGGRDNKKQTIHRQWARGLQRPQEGVEIYQS